MRLPGPFREEEQQYLPFIAGAVFFAATIGFPLGLLLAHAGAHSSTLGGRYTALVQVHGHLQLMGWFGLFILGMGYRLVSRFTAVKVSPPLLVPLSFALVALGLALRAVAQPWADEMSLDLLFVLSAVLEIAGGLIFAAVVLRALKRGRPDEFTYSPFFAAGVIWLAVALALNLAFVTGAALDSRTTVVAARSSAITFVLLYGFVSMFVFAVSLRTFPIFFGLERADARMTIAAWTISNAGIAFYTIATVWRSYEITDANRALQGLGFMLAGVGFLLLIGLLRVFAGTPHRLRELARRSMRFVRFGYAWLLVGGALQVFFGLRALLDERLPAQFEVDAARHFLAAGFVTIIVVGMALLVAPRLALRRTQRRPAMIVGPLLLALLNGAAAARGGGSLIANEMHLEEGYWTMTIGGTLGVIAMLIFAWYLVWSPKQADIPLAVSRHRAGSEVEGRRG